MEDALKVWDELLRTIRTLTTWPLVIFYLVLLFRTALRTQIPALFRSFEALTERLASLKYKGLELDFQGYQKFAATASSPLTQQVAVRLFDAQAGSRRPLFRSASLTGAFNDDAQNKIVGALTGSEGQTRDALLAKTHLPPEPFDAALTSLIQQDAVTPAFSPSHEVVFRL